MEEQKKQSGTAGLGLGLDVNLRIGEIQSTVDQLTNALQSTGEKLSSNVANLVGKLKESMPQLKQAKEKEGGKGEASKTYDRVVSQLREADRRGDEEARRILQSVGEKTEAAGQRMQEGASGQQGRKA